MKNVIKIISIFILIILLFPYVIVNAAVDLTAAQEAIANFAINFQKNHGNEVAYWYMHKYEGYLYRNKAYLFKTKYNHNFQNLASAPIEDPNGKYLLDCVGWINFCVHNATGLDCEVTDSNSCWYCFAAPQTTGSTTYFDYYTPSNCGGLKLGDLVVEGTHIMVYVGNNMMVHSGNIGGNQGVGGGPLTHDPLPANYSKVFRLNQKAADEILQLNTTGGVVGAATSAKGKGGISEVDMADFYYNGIPDGKYSVTKGFFARIIDALKDIFNFLIGLIPNIIKMVFVGWAAIFESLITTAVKTATGDENLETVPVTSTDIESGDNITIEKIVFNKMSIFDVNFFNFN